MRLTKGCTRFVILTSTLAIKIAFPFRPLSPFRIALHTLRMGTFVEKLKKNRGRVLRHAARIATISGITANRQEMRLARQYPQYPLAPVLRSYLWGFIIVMPRGEALKAVPLGWDKSPLLPARLPETDLFHAHQVCRFGGELRFVDFGHQDAEIVLNYLFGEPQLRFTF